DKLLEDLAVARVLQVEGDRALVRRLGEEPGAHVAAIERLVGAGAAALVGVIRMFDLDHVGAKHRKLIGRERPREHVRDIDHPDSFERSHRASPWAVAGGGSIQGSSGGSKFKSGHYGSLAWPKGFCHPPTQD